MRYTIRGATEKTLREIFAEDQELRARLLAILQPQPETHKLTYEEFLAQADEDLSAEWVDGHVITLGPVNVHHQEIRGFLGTVLSIYTETLQLGSIYSGSFQMKLTNSGREPDILFIQTEHLERLKSMYFDGPADLVVEITSPESIARDRGTKFVEYERAGIPEYWLIDPERNIADFYQWDARGYYQRVRPDEAGIYHSSAIRGFWLKVAWLWQPPRDLDALRELGVI